MKSCIVERVIDLAVSIQQIPAPTFEEGLRAEFIRGLFEKESLDDVHIDPSGNVYGRLPGAGEASPLVISAHLDTVFPRSTDLQIAREGEIIRGPGIGDNSLGAAGLLGLLWAIKDRSGNAGAGLLPGDLWLVANVGEEGLGNLCGMKAVVERFRKSVLAYIVVEGMALGQIYHRGLGVKRYRIKVRTPGGHSWVDHGRPSAIHEISWLATRLMNIPLPAHPRTTLNIGKIAGGTSINTIAAEAEMELDLRSEGSQALALLWSQVEALVNQANRGSVQVTAEVIGERPAGEIHTSHPLPRLAARALRAQGIEAHFNVGSTDANAPLSQGLSAICLGLTSGHGAHTLTESVQIRQVEQGLEQLLYIVERAYHELPDPAG